MSAAPRLPAHVHVEPHGDPADVEANHAAASADPGGATGWRLVHYSRAERWLVEHGWACYRPEPAPPREEPAPPAMPQGNPTLKFVRESQRDRDRPVPVLRTLADIPLEAYTWLWRGRFPDDRISIVMGEPGAGKSTLWAWMASVITTGGRWPEGTRCPKGSVLVIQGEEMACKEVGHRVEHFGGDLNKVHFMDGVIRDGGEMTTVSLAHDVPAIEDALDRYGDVRLVVVDPLGEFTQGISGNNENEVRRLLQPLRRMVEHRRVAVLLMVHMNKDDEADITKRIMGSIGFVAVSRMCWFLSEDPFDLTRRCLSFLKGNPDDKIVTGLAYAKTADNRLTWCREPVKMHARQVDNALRELRRRERVVVKSNGPPPTKTRQAMDLILAALAKGPRLQSAVHKEVLGAGVREATFNEALNRLRGKADGDEGEGEEEADIQVLRGKTGPDGRKGKHYWLSLCYSEPPAPPAPDVVTEPDPLTCWLDDGGNPGPGAD